MEFKEYNYIDKEGKSNCIIRSLSKMFKIPYEAVKNQLIELADDMNEKDYTEINVFEKYLSDSHTYPIEYGEDIKIKDLELPNGKYAILCYDKKDYYHMVHIDNGVLYDKSDKSLDLYTIKIYKLDELELYRTWLDNRSFFGGNTFTYDEMGFLWKLINCIGENYDNVMNLKIEPFKPSSKEEIIKNAQDYFDRHNVDLNIDSLIKNDELVLIEKEKEINKYTGYKKDGFSEYSEEKNKPVAYINLTNKTLDSLIIIHELFHNTNQPNGDRNVVSDLFTEAISYTNEVIAGDEFEDELTKANSLTWFFKTVADYANNLYYVYKILLVYKKTNNITLEAYNDCFKDNEYEVTFKNFNRFMETRQSIFKCSYYLLSYALTIYMFEEYKKDNKFFNNIMKLNDSINNLSFKNCLNIIDIKDLDDLLDKYRSSSLEFLEYVTNINNKKR